MNIRDWVSKNFIWILIGLIAANFALVYWGTVNLGIYGAHNSLFGWDVL
ncbi:unnamed protein product, partial [marine sediment metagenome]